MAEHPMAGPGMARGFLASLPRQEQAALSAVGRPRGFRRGDRLFLEGDRSSSVYLVVEGRARVFTTTEEGNEVTLSVRGPGDLVGEMAALDPAGLRSATVTVLDPLRCRVIMAAELRDFLERYPRAALALLQLVIGRLRDSDRRRAEFGSYDATRRLARILVETAAGGAGSSGGAVAPAPLGLELSQRELAGLIGASRESVARGLAELRNRGLVTTGRRVITICDPAALSLYAG